MTSPHTAARPHCCQSLRPWSESVSVSRFSPSNMDRVIVSCCFLIFTFYFVIGKAGCAAVETSKSGESTSTQSKSRKGDQPQEPLIYPSEPHLEGSLNRWGSVIDTAPAPCPDNSLFCEASHDYPKDIIKNKLKKQPKLLLDILYEEELVDIHNKFGPDTESEMELCTSTAKIIYPDKAQSKEGVFEFVVNDNEHRQGVRVETCMNNGGECKEMPAHLLSLGYKSKCVQKYILRTLVVLNRNSSSSDVQGFVTKPFEFPSCCSCVITMSVNNRFGFEGDTTPANVVTQPPTKLVKGTTKS